ncbi:unnamed protein product [Phaedon cochleariae]|uniref:Uncharacterized protein n=1 Tax=Phaedon cochleariae TaxID=80249 RepID=A0A9N9SK84_PHACE|nr:unnamed protein product [Phaedon cochleariae]
MIYDLNKPVVIQDTIHIITKLKTRFLKPGVVLPMGSYFVSSTHIEQLMKLFSKDQHFLTTGDLQSMDKMNFEAANKLCSNSVINLLRGLLKDIEGSEATAQYLLMQRRILEAFVEKNMEINTRIYNMWYSILFLRVWRQWLSRNNYSMEKNFISQNAYTCIELNGHGLILLTQKLKQEASSFLPWYFSSQPCEKIFRQTRSMTSTFSTIVNFSLTDILGRLSRIQTLNEISTDLGSTYCFPKEQNIKLGKSNLLTLWTGSMPAQEEISKILEKASEKAKDDANNDAKKLGIIADDNDFSILNMPVLHSGKSDDIVQDEDINQDINYEEIAADPERDHIEKELNTLSSLGTINLKDNVNQVKCGQESKFLRVLVNGKMMTLRKSTLCWLFSDKSGRLSSDRIMRVRGMSASNYKKENVKKIQTPRSRSKDFNKNCRDAVVDLNCDSNSEDTTDEEDYSIQNSSEGPEDFEKSSDSESVMEITIKEEEYYAVYYDLRWYLGRVISVEEHFCEVKFLKEDMGEFHWPKKDDKQRVERNYSSVL